MDGLVKNQYFYLKNIEIICFLLIDSLFNQSITVGRVRVRPQIDQQSVALWQAKSREVTVQFEERVSLHKLKLVSSVLLQ